MRDFLWNTPTLSIFELEKCSFFFKQVRISPEIDWYHYQNANAAPTGIVRLRHRIKTGQFSRSVTPEPTVGGRGWFAKLKVIWKSFILILLFIKTWGYNVLGPVCYHNLITILFAHDIIILPNNIQYTILCLSAFFDIFH